MGSPAVVGAAAATCTALGARRERDVEPDRARLGILEQRNMGTALIGHRSDTAGLAPISL
jgi:hypothetical protein